MATLLGMFGFHLARHDGHSVLRVTGDVRGEEDRDLLIEALAFVQHDDHLILDLSAVADLDGSAARRLHDLMMRRSIVAESVIVSTHEDVSMQLVLHDVDRLCPIVPSVSDATRIIMRPSMRLHSAE